MNSSGHIPQEKIYNFLHENLPLEYPDALNKIREIRDAIPHPGKMPIKYKNDFVGNISRENLAEKLIELYKLGCTEIKVSYFPKISAGTDIVNDWFWNSETQEEECITYEVNRAEKEESFSINYIWNNPNYKKELDDYNSALTAHEQSRQSRAKILVMNNQNIQFNNSIIAAARMKNLLLWRSVAKAIATGQKPDLKEIKKELLLKQLAELED